MPLQNRVHPNGELFAVTSRGTMLGNRGGKFHRDDKTLGKRRWASHHWIACELHYKNMHHEPMGRGYTSLFFLDEVTALAAGHRPCFFCRRADAKRFVELSGMETIEFDSMLHKERVKVTSLPTALRWAPSPQRGEERPSLLLWRSCREATEEVPLPDGVMVDIDGAPHALRRNHLLRWSFDGYTEAIARTSSMRANLLTPPTIIGILAKGYQPRWHPSAEQWGTS